MTKAQLLKFCMIRNASGFSSNLQFSIDAGEAGFKIEELGQVARRWDESGQANGYRWETPHGQLIEYPNGHMALLEPTPDGTTTFEQDNG